MSNIFYEENGILKHIKMKTYKIPILLGSIKRNPEAGKTHEMIPTYKEISFSCDVLPEFMRNFPEQDLIVTEHSLKDEFTNCRGLIFSDKTAYEIIKNSKEISPRYGLTLEMHQNYNDVFWETPNPEYLYKYRKIKVKCNECKETFYNTELEYGEIDECSCCGNGYSYSNTKCPKCGEWDCCELEYEKIEDALKRINGKRTKQKLCNHEWIDITSVEDLPRKRLVCSECGKNNQMNK